MQATTKLYNQIVFLTQQVKNNLKTRGIAIPTKNDKGEILIGKFSVLKDKHGYAVLNQRKETLYSHLNLPQTAILIANNLALNQSVNPGLIANDYRYGYNNFDEKNYARLAKSYYQRGDWERYDSTVIKHELAQDRAETAKMEIMKQFQKLGQLR